MKVALLFTLSLLQLLCSAQNKQQQLENCYNQHSYDCLKEFLEEWRNSVKLPPQSTLFDPMDKIRSLYDVVLDVSDDDTGYFVSQFTLPKITIGDSDYVISNPAIFLFPKNRGKLIPLPADSSYYNAVITFECAAPRELEKLPWDRIARKKRLKKLKLNYWHREQFIARCIGFRDKWGIGIYRPQVNVSSINFSKDMQEALVNSNGPKYGGTTYYQLVDSRWKELNKIPPYSEFAGRPIGNVRCITNDNMHQSCITNTE